MYTKALHADHGASEAKLLSVDFVKKYIQYAKQKLTPSLSEEAANLISTAYVPFHAVNYTTSSSALCHG